MVAKMRGSSKVTENWWMIFRCFPPEPFGLWRLYTLSICITLLLFSLAALCAFYKHGWNKEPTISCKLGICTNQRNYRKERLMEACEDREAAIKRIKLLKEIRSDPKDKNFSQTWSWFEKEIDQLKKVVKRSEKYQINSLGKSFPHLISLIFFSLIVYLFIGRLVVLHTRSIQSHFGLDEISQNKISNWMLPHFIFGFLIAVFMILSEIATSVLDQEKTWFGWDSFCVTPSAFVIKCVALISFGLVAVTPFTMLWCVSRKKYIPPAMPSARDGKFGAGRYVEFLQTWTLWLILVPATLGIVWMRYVVEKEPRFSSARLLYVIGPGVIITLIVVKLIRNAIILRFRCYDSLSEEAFKERDKQPTDPTISFLGTEWWKLPATISVALASIWVLLGWLGMSKIILNLIR